MQPSLDRARACPVLVRLYLSVGRHRSPADYSGNTPPRDVREILVHAWRDCTLRELAEEVKFTLLREGKVSLTPLSRLEFGLVYPNTQGRLTMQALGVVRAFSEGADDKLTLETVKHQAGDSLDVAVLP